MQVKNFKVFNESFLQSESFHKQNLLILCSEWGQVSF